MYTLGTRMHFDAAHCLRGYEGKCARLHGHRWEVEVVCASAALDEVGMAADFSLMKKALSSVIDGLDHRELNSIPPFDTLNPTAENLARAVYERLKGALPIELREVKVWESPDCWAAYAQAAPTR